MRPFSKPKIGILLLVAAALLLLAAPPSHRVFINLSASMPRGLYLKVSKDSVRTGDLVIVTIPDSVRRLASNFPWLSATTPFLKKVLAVEGARLCKRGSAFVVDELTVAHIADSDLSGNSLPQLQGCTTVGKNEVALIGDASDRSFDSRYFGPISVSLIRDHVKPIFLF